MEIKTLQKGDIAAYFSWLFYPLQLFPNCPIPDPSHLLHAQLTYFDVASYSRELS